MYWLDTTILAVLAIVAIFGAISGLVMQLARIVGFVVALYAAVYFNDGASSLLQQGFIQDAEPWMARLVAYVGVFLVVYLGVFLLSMLLERGLRGVKLQAMNRLLGAALGGCKAALILGAAFLAMKHLPLPPTQEVMQKSALAPVLAQGVENLVSAVASEYRDELRDGLEGLGRTLREHAPQ